MAETANFQRNDARVDLPTRIFLTSDGMRLFAPKPGQLKRFKNLIGVARDCLADDAYNALLVQKMVLNGCIEEVYICLPNLLQYRQSIISTNNLILFAILYKKLTPSLAEVLCQSSVVQAYNRKNPKYAIVNINAVSRVKIDTLRAEKPQLFESMENEIADEVRAKIHRQPISDEDKQTRIRSLDKFIAWIDHRIWYMYLIVYQTTLRQELIKSFSDMIITYLSRTAVATHLSSLLMEFIQNAEKAHFERLIVRCGLAKKNEVDAFLRERVNRERAIEEAQRVNQMLDLAWSMNPDTTSVGQQYKIGITLSNFGLITEETRMELAKKMRADTKGIALANFYKEKDPKKEDSLGAGLGLLYNSYLEEVCQKEGIMYKCNIYPEPEKEKTTVKIELLL
ncbi:MAG: hypothetical protein LBC99_08735 [Spirochaetota bacterium]|jgi:hypothetical protein|nr:hypothetical protein [Spirochaetota bacterium]